MTIQEADNYFETLIKTTTRKTELKVYQEFIEILKGLKKRTLTKDEIQSIETELESYNFTSNLKSKRKFFKKSLSKFEEFLKDRFSLTSKAYYTKLGITLGASFGILFGVVFLSSWERSMGISLGLIIGSGIGGAVGRSLDSKAKSEGRVL